MPGGNLQKNILIAITNPNPS